MRKIIFHLLFFSSLIFGNPQLAKASHAVGADLTYVYIGPNEYEVTVKFYRDCSGQVGALPLNDIEIEYVSSCGNGIAVINAISGTGQEILTGIYPPCTVTSCGGGLGYGVREYVYRGTVFLPVACSDWVFSATIYARNTSITTIDGTNLPSLYVEAFLDNSNNIIDASPVFSTPPVARFCANHPYTYNQGAIDPDGDSLVYSLVDALQGAGSIVPYFFPYSGINPIASTPGVSINPSSGIITLNPTTVQIGVIAILVEEFRNGVLIGTVRRDIQVNVEAICNFPPVLQPATFNTSNIHCGDSIIYLHLTLPVRCFSVAADGSDFRMTAPSGLPIPVLREVPINCIGGLTDSIELHLYPPNITENGTYFLYSKLGNDGNTLLNDCGVAMNEYDTARFVFNGCHESKVDLKNVSVSADDSSMEITWAAPVDTGWPNPQFQRFDIYRSNSPDGSYTRIDSVLSQNATFYTDTTVEVPLQPYDYAIRIRLNWGFECPKSDSIQSIYLTGAFNSDSLTIALNWTPYWGWPGPSYQIMQSEDSGVTFHSVDGASTTGTTINYIRPLEKGRYWVRIESANSGLVARSNWYEFDIIKFDVIAPNVITPNADGKNDSFYIENLNLYPNSRLNIYNRWGKKIFESGNYNNDWKGENMPEGVYYYTLKLADSKSSEMTGTVNIIRNK